MHRKPDQRRTDQHFVGDRVSQLAELAGHAVAASQRAVKPVGDDGHRENDECGYPTGCFVAIAGEQEEQEDRYQNQTQTGEQVGDVNHPVTPNSRRSLGLARHGKQNIGSTKRPVTNDAARRLPKLKRPRRRIDLCQLFPVGVNAAR